MTRRHSERIQQIGVLLVDDAPGDTSAMERLLQDVKIPAVVVCRASTVAQAKGVLATGSPDVVLLRYGLGHHAGDGQFTAVRDLSELSTVIVFAPAGEAEFEIEALRCGALDFLVADHLNAAALSRVLRHAVTRAELERKLRESEHRYRVLFEHSGTAMLLIDGALIRMVNGRAESLLGYPRQEIEGCMEWKDLVSPGEAERLTALLSDATAAEPIEFETQVVQRSGVARSVLVNMVGAPGGTARIVSLLDLSSREAAEAEVRRQREYFRALFENSPEAIVAFDQHGSVLDVNPSFERLFGYSREEMDGQDLVDWIVPSRHASRAGAALGLDKSDDAYIPATTRRRRDGSEIHVSVLRVPIILDGTHVGAFSIYHDVTAERESRERLEEAFIDLVETTVRMMGSVDPYTATHQRMVARLADIVGRRLGLDDDRLQGLYVGALLHDVGKLSLPSTILTKPGKLSAQEWALIRSHPRRGYEMLLDAKLPWPVADMALRHHERLDGSGYPDGVTGSGLSTEIRILNVCDVVEAMSSDRPYRPGLSMDEVLAELSNGSGIRYDSRVVEAMVEAIRNGEVVLGAGYDRDE
jgi:PAS domain S-box-containing protein